MGAAPGTDIAIGVDNFESARAFANKIWNASRLIFMKMESSGVELMAAARSIGIAALPEAAAG